MNKQTKDILGLMIIVVPIFAILYVGWHFTPMYKDIKAEQRRQAQIVIIESYNNPDVRQALIEKYGFTEDEISPSVLFEKLELSGVEDEYAPVDNK